MKVRKKILSVFCIITIVLGGYIWFVHDSEEIVIKNDKYFKIIDKGEERYFYAIYNVDGKLIKSGESYRIEPLIDYIDQETIQILIVAGTDTFYCFYYDIINDKFSEQYESPIVAKYDKVAFLDYRNGEFVLIVRDMFDEGNYYKEFFLDFSSVLSPVIHAEFTDDDTILISYISGDLYEEKTELLHL